MRNLGVRALLGSAGLCGLVLVLGLVPSLGPVLWAYWVPGMAAIAYPWNAIPGEFDPTMHRFSVSLMILADVLFWWLVIYTLLRLWRNWRTRSGTT
jgi:hypothetical protein